MSRMYERSIEDDIVAIGRQHKLAGVGNAPLLGLAGLGIPLAGYLGLRAGEARGNRSAKQRAYAGFGAGLAAGVAAPNMVQKLKGVLDSAQGHTQVSPREAMYSKQGSVYPSLSMMLGTVKTSASDQYPHLDYFMKEAGVVDWTAKHLGDAAHSLGGASHWESVANGLGSAASDVGHAASEAGHAAAKAKPAAKAVEDVAETAVDAAKKSPVHWGHYAAYGGLPVAGAGVGYLAGQNEVESRPLMGRVFT